MNVTMRGYEISAEDIAHLADGDVVKVESDEACLYGTLRGEEGRLTLWSILFRATNGEPGTWLCLANSVTYPAPPKPKLQAGWWEKFGGKAYYFDGDAWYAGRGGIRYSDDVAPFINNCDLRYIGPAPTWEES